jgi:hypothetical protein
MVWVVCDRSETVDISGFLKSADHLITRSV